MFGLGKRNVEFEGMDCLADQMLEAYIADGTVSQATVGWMAQAHYAKVTVYFGVVIIFIALFKNVWFLYADKRYRKSTVGIEPGYFGSFMAILVSYSRYFGYKPVNMYVSKMLGLPSTSGSFLFVVASTAYLACYSMIPHYWYRGCAGFGTPPLAIRLGVMATALLPFIYTLSGKFNIISLLTGISYEKLNVFHQFTGVASFVLSLMHTIPFIYQSLAEGGFLNLKVVMQGFSYYSGIPPLILMGFLTLGGSSIVRKYWYEAFLHVHWICGVAFYATMVWHIDQSLGMWDYMWAALAFWMFQLIYRALVKTCFKPNSFFLRPRPAQLRKLDKGTFEVTVANVPDMTWSPGQHCYLRFVGGRILDNHPFSITSIPQTEENELRFIIIPKQGFTGKLFEELDKSITSNKKVYIDGPYGGTNRDPLSFNNLTMISSGSGVTVCLPFLQHSARAINNAIANKEGSVLKDIHFLWIIRYEDNINWIKEELEEAIRLAGNYITIDIYICNKPEVKNSATIAFNENSAIDQTRDFEKGEEFSNEGVPLINSDNVNIYYHKPNLASILDDSKRFLKRKNFIVSSGSESMRREVCHSVSNLQRLIFNEDYQQQKQPIEEIYLHTEAFGW